MMTLRTTSLCSILLLCTAQLPAQCEQPQGNAVLGLGGNLPYLGNTITLQLSGANNASFVVALDTKPGPTKLPWGTVCLQTPILIYSGFALSGTGRFTQNISIPSNLKSLVGVPIYLQGAVADTAAPNGFLALSNSVKLVIKKKPAVTTIYFDDFEVQRSPPGWSASNGLWEIGIPSKVGPTKAYSGSACAATFLAKQYPSSGANTRHSSRPIQLPTVTGGNEIRLTYRMWYHTEDVRDACLLQVRTLPSGTWNSVVGSPSVSGWSRLWTQCGADLTAYAGKQIQLGFLFTSTDNRYYPAGGDGVYIDDVHIFQGTPNPNLQQTTEDWEQGIGFWWGGDNGLWEVGTPTGKNAKGKKVGPQDYGQNCAAIVLNDTYPSAGANTRLVSPPVKLPASPVRWLYFKNWFLTENGRDMLTVQVSTDRGATWINLPGTVLSGNGSSWTWKQIPLQDFTVGTTKVVLQGKTILIGFNFTSTDDRYYPAGGDGVYLDDISVR